MLKFIRIFYIFEQITSALFEVGGQLGGICNKMDIQELKHILYNINHLCSHIELSRIEVKKIDFEKHNHIYIDVHRLLDIYICSLIDEFKILEKLVKKSDNYYISDTYYVLIPLVNYIKKFDSLRIKRNKILAHHNRDINNVFTPWWKELKGKRFATTNDEEKAIFSIIKCIHQILKKQFEKELKEVLEQYDKEIDEYEKQIMEVPNVDSFKDTVPIIREVQKRMKERDFSFTIMSKSI